MRGRMAAGLVALALIAGAAAGCGGDGGGSAAEPAGSGTSASDPTSSSVAVGVRTLTGLNYAGDRLDAILKCDDSSDIPCISGVLADMTELSDADQRWALATYQETQHDPCVRDATEAYNGALTYFGLIDDAQLRDDFAAAVNYVADGAPLVVDGVDSLEGCPDALRDAIFDEVEGSGRD